MLVNYERRTAIARRGETVHWEKPVNWRNKQKRAKAERQGQKWSCFFSCLYIVVQPFGQKTVLSAIFHLVSEGLKSFEMQTIYAIMGANFQVSCVARTPLFRFLQKGGSPNWWNCTRGWWRGGERNCSKRHFTRCFLFGKLYKKDKK